MQFQYIRSSILSVCPPVGLSVCLPVSLSVCLPDDFTMRLHSLLSIALPFLCVISAARFLKVFPWLWLSLKDNRLLIGVNDWIQTDQDSNMLVIDDSEANGIAMTIRSVCVWQFISQINSIDSYVIKSTYQMSWWAVVSPSDWLASLGRTVTTTRGEHVSSVVTDACNNGFTITPP